MTRFFLNYFKDDKTALTTVKFSIYKIAFIWGVLPIVSKKLCSTY